MILRCKPLVACANKRKVAFLKQNTKSPTQLEFVQGPSAFTVKETVLLVFLSVFLVLFVSQTAFWKRCGRMATSCFATARASTTSRGKPLTAETSYVLLTDHTFFVMRVGSGRRSRWRLRSSNKARSLCPRRTFSTRRSSRLEPHALTASLLSLLMIYRCISVIETRTFRMSWGTSTVYIHVRLLLRILSGGFIMSSRCSNT